MGGGGVDGVIHRKAGPELRQACIEIKKEMGIKFLPPGKAVITPGFNLPSKYIIHTVGPIYNRRDVKQPGQLRACYANSMDLASSYKCKSIAFSNISTGIYRYPKHEAAEIAIETVRSYRESIIEMVFFVCFDNENFEIYTSLI